MRKTLPKPLGILLLGVSLVAYYLVPRLAVFDRGSFVSIANSEIPKGYPAGSFESVSNEPVFKAVLRNGGQIVLASQVQDSAQRFGDKGLGAVGGLWDPGDGTIKLSTEGLTYETFIQILNHEGIHMAQSCHAGGLTSGSIPIGLSITPEGLMRLEEYRDDNPAYYASKVEREAYSNDTRPASEIAELIDEYCGSKPWIPLFGALRSKLQAALLGQ